MILMLPVLVIIIDSASKIARDCEAGQVCIPSSTRFVGQESPSLP